MNVAKITFGTKAVDVKAYPYEDGTDISKKLDFLGELRKIEKKCHKHNMNKIDKWLHEEDN